MPFLEDSEEYYSDDDRSSFEPKSQKSRLFGDKAFYIIGGVASLGAFLVIVAYIYNSSKPVDLGDLPVIQAEVGPVKVKPASNKQVEHQDKIVYDNISGDTRVIKEHIAPVPEEPTLDYTPASNIDEEVLSREEKENIIKEFDELAPRKTSVLASSTKRYETDRTSMIKSKKKASNELKKFMSDSLQKSRKVQTAGSVVDIPKKYGKGTIMVQIASVDSKTAAEAEYKRLLHRNYFLKDAGKRIVKVDLGAKGIKYRVQVGPFKNRKDANRIVSLVKSNGFSAYIAR